jgi:DNA-binding NarL/FixJ family response regulator
MMRQRIFLADDHSLLLEAFSKLLVTKYDIVGTATDGRKMLAAVSKLKPDVVLMDIRMPGMDGLEAPIGALDHYNAACSLALAGEAEAALAALERCADLVAAGKVDSRAAITERMFETDPDLGSIRAQERFGRAMKKAFPDKGDGPGR